MKRNYDDPQYTKARKICFRRDRYKCKICNSKEKICAHHLDSWDWFIAGRYESKNMITLCKSHHEEFHQRFGKGHNTIYQFDQYLNYYHATSLAELMAPKKRKRK